jgi:hypothetical protein
MKLDLKEMKTRSERSERNENLDLKEMKTPLNLSCMHINPLLHTQFFTFISIDLRDQNKNCRSPEPTKKDKRREG